MLAFVRIRDLALQMPFPFLELALKGIYITYMRNTKFTNEATLPHHVLLGNCVVELYGLDLASSYQHAFVYIRELAITLRKTITSPSPETFKAVLNWQFFNQLRVWTAVVCAYPDESQLRPLVYPLCQLLFAVVRLASTIRYAPMRFQCVKLLQQLAFATHSFVPTAPVLLEVLQMPPFSTSYRGSGKGKGGQRRLVPARVWTSTSSSRQAVQVAPRPQARARPAHLAGSLSCCSVSATSTSSTLGFPSSRCRCCSR
ncbi:hypothetical protein PINS_up018119 [Pythium insidiosum]|nr:hypothetical protein PINS_up018119 [Pythium insidiosum]